MYEHVSYHLDDARMIKEEILADYDSNWFHPKGLGPGIFDRGRMRFINRNLNYLCRHRGIRKTTSNVYVTGMINKQNKESLCLFTLPQLQDQILQ